MKTIYLVSILVLTATCFASACSVPTHTNPGTGRIAFASRRDGLDYQVYLMNGDGSGVTNLANDNSANASPAWSPDGKRIAFSSDRDDVELGDLYVMNADGSEQTRLTHSGQALAPNWSPDGKRIAFISMRVLSSELGLYGSSIAVMNADGSGQRQLTDPDTPLAVSPSDASVKWLPDSKRLVYLSGGDLYSINDDGSELTRVTNNAMMSAFDWSPDNTRIVYLYGSGLEKELYVMNVDGSNQVPLTKTVTYKQNPRWSPDSSRIAFVSHAEDLLEIYVINADGSGETRLTTNDVYDVNPAWQP